MALFALFLLHFHFAKAVELSFVPYCESKAVKPIPVVVLIIQDKDRFLFLLRAKGEGDIWAPPTESVESKESLALAVKRGAEEELGVKVTPQIVLMDHLARSKDVYLYWVLTELNPGEVPRNASPQESSELRWMTIDEIAQKEAAGQTHPHVTELLLRAMKNFR